MTWLVLSAPVEIPGQDPRVEQRRFNFDRVTVYEPNAEGGAFLILMGATSIMVVNDSVFDIDAALCDAQHRLRVKANPITPRPYEISPEMERFLP